MANKNKNDKYLFVLSFSVLLFWHYYYHTNKLYNSYSLQAHSLTKSNQTK